jgi:hypothetical protein
LEDNDDSNRLGPNEAYCQRKCQRKSV